MASTGTLGCPRDTSKLVVMGVLQFRGQFGRPSKKKKKAKFFFYVFVSRCGANFVIE